MRIAFLGDGSLGHVRRWAGYFHERGHDVLLVSFEDVTGCPFPAKRIRKRLPTKIAGYAAAVGAIRRELGAFSPEIVNAIYVAGYGLVGALAGYRPLVVSAIGSDMLVDYPSSPVHRMQIRYALSSASLVTTDAAALTGAVERVGVERARIVEIVFGVDPSIFNRHGASRPGDGPLRIVSTRNLYPIYRVDTLVDAFSEVSASVDARLVICGDGPERDALERRAREAGLSGKVTFTGRLDPAGIAGELKKADIYVSTSLSDSTSVSLLEAMACGAVPVVTDLAANREWISPGRSGALCPAGDHHALAAAILEIHSDPSAAEAMRDEAAAEVDRRGLWLPNMETAEAEFTRLAGGDDPG